MNETQLSPRTASEMERIKGDLKGAFEAFDNRGRLLQAAYDKLQNELARANRDLNQKNTALSQKVQELQQMSSRLQCVLESLTDGVLVIGENLTVEECNPAAARLLSATRSAIEGRSYPQVVQDLSNVEDIRLALLEGQTVHDQQRRCADGHGGWIDVLASVAPIRTPDGRILGAVEVLRDVTEFHELETRLRHKDRMAALGEMAASVAHEIRNPLGTIEGFARLLQRDLEAQPNHKRLADKIVEGAQNLNYVITNLLTYVRPMTLQVEQFDVGKLLASVAECLAAGIGARGIRLEIAELPEPLSMKGDIRQLRQVLLNIGLNAIEACQAGQGVKIAASRRGRDVCLCVRDNGSGIPPDDIPKIFDPFFTTKQGGTGLGLSLCHKIVIAHNGRIDVTSIPDKGSVFEILLPDGGGKP